MDIEQTAIQTLLNVGLSIGGLKEVNGIKVAVVPQGYELKSLENLQKYAPNPIRKRLMHYFNIFKLNSSRARTANRSGT